MVTWNLLDVLPGFLDNKYSKFWHSSLFHYPPLIVSFMRCIYIIKCFYVLCDDHPRVFFPVVS